MRTLLQIVLCTGLVCHVTFVGAHAAMALRRKLGLGRPPELDGDEPVEAVSTFGAAPAAIRVHARRAA